MTLSLTGTADLGQQGQVPARRRQAFPSRNGLTVHESGSGLLTLPI